MATPGTPLSFSDVLRLRPVRRLWIAQIVSVFGDFLAVFAIIAVVTFKLHGTATQVAMVLVSFMAPLAIVSPLAGVFVDRWHLKRTMIASDLIRGVLVLTLTIDRQALRTESSAVLDSMRQGFGFIFKHSTISFVILSMTAGMFAMRCFGALLSIYVRDVLHSTSAVFGVLNTLIGIGMIIGTQLLTRFARHIPQQDLVVYGLGEMGIAVLTTAAFGTMGSTAAGMLGLGLCASAIFITATTLIQHETPHELLGRVMSCLMSLVAGSQVISMC